MLAECSHFQQYIFLATSLEFHISDKSLKFTTLDRKPESTTQQTPNQKRKPKLDRAKARVAVKPKWLDNISALF